MFNILLWILIKAIKWDSVNLANNIEKKWQKVYFCCISIKWILTLHVRYMYLQPQKTRSRTSSGRQSKVYPLYHITKKQNPVLENVMILKNMYKKNFQSWVQLHVEILFLSYVLNDAETRKLQVRCVQVLHPLILL